MEKNTKIISGFPGVGKTYYTNNSDNDMVILDSDSSLFSWIYNENGDKTNERNPDFPSNYISHIKENIGKADIIFVSTHDIVLKELNNQNIPHYVVLPRLFPRRDIKKDWIQRYIDRGSDDEFILLMENKFYDFINDIHDNNKIGILIEVHPGEYIEDAIRRGIEDEY